MTAIKSTHEQLGMREFVLAQLDDAIGGLLLFDADQNGLGGMGAGGVQHIKARAVAVVDLESELPGSPDHLHVDLDDRHVDALGQQGLGYDLSEATKPDEEHAPVQVGRLIDTVHRLFLFRQQPLACDDHQRGQRHGEDDDRRHAGDGLCVHDSRRQRTGVENEGKLATLRKQHGAVDRLGMARPEDTGDDIDAQALHRHEGENAAGDDLPVGDNEIDVQRHPDAKKEEPEQNAAEGLHVGLELVAEGGLRQHYAGEECAHRHREAAELHKQRGAEHDQKCCGGHHLARAGAREDAEQRVHHPLARHKHQEYRASCDADRLPPRRGSVSCALRAGHQTRDDRNQGEQRHDHQILEQEDGNRALSAGSRDFTTILQHLHDDGGRREHEAEGADERCGRRQPEGDTNSGEQDAARHHLRRAESKNVAPHRPQLGRAHFETDEEKEHHDAKFGDVDDGLRVGDQLEDMGADNDAGSQIAQDRPKAEQPEDRHSEHTRRKQGNRQPEVWPGSVCNFMFHNCSSLSPSAPVRDRRRWRQAEVNRRRE